VGKADSDHHVVARTPVERRGARDGLAHLLDGLSASTLPTELLAGVTLLAIAVPEQLATAQLAEVPAFLALLAFLAATLVFVVVGSNPVMSIGADSTIAPLFAVTLLRLAAPQSPAYLSLVAATAVLTGVLVAAVGAARLGWLADFLSVPLVTGFMLGISVIITVHQLPHALGLSGGGESVGARLTDLAHQLHATSAWSLGLALGTLALMLVGERVNPRWPTALVAVVGAAALARAFDLTHHGVAELGRVTATLPAWRLGGLTWHDWGVALATSLTLLVVIVSQSAATARASSSEAGLTDDLDRDFLGVGLANVAAGLVGAFPVDASPARTEVTVLAGGRTKAVGLVVAAGVLAVVPLVRFAHLIPLPALAGVLFFIALRLVKPERLRAIWRTSRAESALVVVAALGVVVLGVEIGLALAVGLAIAVRTWRSSRPRMIELGRRHGTTSWESLREPGVARVPHVLVVFFDEALYFANAEVFRRDLYGLLQRHPGTRHVVIDAVATPDVDYTGLVTLSQAVLDLEHDGVSVAVARANAHVTRQFARFASPALHHLGAHASVDEAVQSSLGAKR
jgi:SulP family sulfate permease